MNHQTNNKKKWKNQNYPNISSEIKRIPISEATPSFPNIQKRGGGKKQFQIAKNWKNQNYPNISAFKSIKKIPIIFPIISKVYVSSPTIVFLTYILPPSNGIWYDTADWNDELMWMDY